MSRRKRNIIIRLLIGINLYALTINLLQGLDLGMGSFDSLTLELQSIFGITEFGNASFLLHFIFFIVLTLLCKKYKLNIKYLIISIFSVFLLTRVVNIYSMFELSVNANLLNSILVILVLNLGLYFIASTNLIIAPFDKFVVETSIHTKIALGKMRLITDISLLVAVVLINFVIVDKINITLFTIIITFATGLNIHAYDVVFTKFNLLNIEEN